jgi:hypothetical protein
LIPSLEAYTEELCELSARAAGIRAALLDVERICHRKGKGWDDPPVVFSIGASLDGETVRYIQHKVISRALTEALQSNDYNLFKAMDTIAKSQEYMRQNGIPAELNLSGPLKGKTYPPPAPDEDMQTDEDMQIGHDGLQFFGFGLAFVGWSLEIKLGTAEGERRMDMAYARRVDEHEDRREARTLRFMARNGVQWRCVRFRGEMPTVLAVPPGDPRLEVGGVMNGLSRMTNAVASTSVPIAPASVPRVNPLFRPQT